MVSLKKLVKEDDLRDTEVFFMETSCGTQDNTSKIHWLTSDKSLDHVTSFIRSTLFYSPFSFFLSMHYHFPHCQQCLEFAVD